MVSIKDVARVAGVSTATVSRYINDPKQVKQPTREKVQKAIAATNYAPNSLARNFRRGKTGVILVALPAIGTPFFADVMKGITTIARDMHYSILIKETQLNQLSYDEYTNLVLSKQADGIILLSAIIPFATAKPQQTGNQRPAPIILSCENVTPELGRYPSVRIDNARAAAEATDYLINLGHKKIAFIFGLQSSTLTLDRERGYRKAMKAAKLAIADGWITEGGLTLDGARKATRLLLSHAERPSAIFCANDEMAMAAIHEIKAARLRVPQDISIIGFDDICYAELMDPPLTTISQPAEEIGERTMLRLSQAIDGRDIGVEPEIVPHKLVVRSSTAAPAKRR